MTEAIIVALIAGAFSLAGVMISNARTKEVMKYQIEQLREEVKKHNGLIERTYKLEETAALHEAELKRHNARIGILEETKEGKA